MARVKPILKIFNIYDDFYLNGRWDKASDYFDQFDPVNDDLAEVVLPHLTMTGPGMIGEKVKLIKNREEILQIVRDRLVNMGRNPDEVLIGLYEKS